MDQYRPLVAGPSAVRDLYTVVIVSHSAVALNLSPIIVDVVRGAFPECRADKRASERVACFGVGVSCGMAPDRTTDGQTHDARLWNVKGGEEEKGPI